jgi:hypothetical protein
MPEAAINGRRRFSRNAAVPIGALELCGVVAIASGAADAGPMPGLDGAMAWLNSPPLSSEALRGKVVLLLGRPRRRIQTESAKI